MSASPFRIFVVEDNEWYNRLLVHHLELNPDYEVESYARGNDCLQNLHKQPDVVTLDYRLPDISGMEVLRRIKQENKDVFVILISEQSEIEVVVDLLKEGAYDYIVKSDDIKERLHNTILNIRKQIGLRNEISELKREVHRKYQTGNLILGESNGIKKIHELISKALATNINVSICGETGTGKELVAKAIHYNSDRKSKPFVAVNVSAIPSELIESELFGHEKGAFTGAASMRRGKFEEADGGTLFLDEIGEMDPSFQPKLLRALQEREITRIGSNRTIRINCRIISSTNKDLAEEVKQGRFRKDLFYRLQGLPVELPPLRERDKDVLILAGHFIHGFCNENKMKIRKLSSPARQKLLQYTYPGNIRELKSVMELAVTLSGGEEIEPGDIIFTGESFADDVPHGDLTLREYQRRIVLSYLKKYRNDVRLVAGKLDIGTATVYRLLKEAKERDGKKSK